MERVEHEIVQIRHVPILVQADGLLHNVVEVTSKLLCPFPGHAFCPESETVVVSHVGVVGAEGPRLPSPSLITREGSMLVFTVACAEMTRMLGSVTLLSCNIDILVKLLCLLPLKPSHVSLKVKKSNKLD